MQDESLQTFLIRLIENGITLIASRKHCTYFSFYQGLGCRGQHDLQMEKINLD